MSDPPFVSVITPTRNQALWIDACLASVRSQTYANVEHIVVDGASTDDTVKRLAAAEGSYNLRWTSQPDDGMYDAINTGMATARGDIVAYLNSDDLYLPWTLESVVKAFAAAPEVDFIYGDSLRLDEATGRLQPAFQHPFDLRPMTASGSLIQPAVFWRRRVLETLGGFDATIRYAGDLDFWLRAAEAGLRFQRIDEVLAVDRAHAASLSSSRFDEMAAEIVRVRSSHRGGRRPSVPTRLIRRTQRELSSRRLWLAFAASTRSGGSDKRWVNIRGSLATPVSLVTALLGAAPIVGGRVRQTLRWRSDVLRAVSAPGRIVAQDPLVTVVTPSFRHAQWIAETIESVRIQTYPRIEHIVVDGGSDDGTEAILRAAERPGFRWLSEPDRGQADAINKGMQLATGEIVTWLNSDDIYVDPDAIARVVDRFRQGSVVVTGPGRKLSEQGRVVGSIAVRPDRLDAATTRHVDWILQPSTFYTRELAFAHPLDPTLLFAMDWDFFIRVTAEARIDVVNQPIAGYRIHRASKTVGGGASRQRELLRVLERYHPASAWNVRVMRLMVKAHAAAERLPRKAAWLATRSLNAIARLTSVVTNGRGLPP